MNNQYIYGEEKSNLNELIRSTIQSMGWLVLAFFLMDSWWVLDSIMVYVTGRPVSQVLHISSMVLALFLGLVSLKVFFKKAAGGRLLKFSSALYVFLCLLFLNAAASFLARIWAERIPALLIAQKMSDYLAGLSYLALVVVIAALAVYLSLYTIAFVIYEIPLPKAGRLWSVFTGLCFRRFFLFILLVMGGLLGAIVLVGLVKAGDAVFISAMPRGFFARYFLTLLIAGAKAAFVILMLFFTSLLLNGREEIIRKVWTEESKAWGLFPIFLLVLCLVFSVPSLLGRQNGLEQEINGLKSRIARGDMLRNERNGFLAAAEYSNARTDLLALQGLITGLGELRQGDDLSEACSMLEEAKSAGGDHSKINYFTGLLLQAKSLQKKADPDAHLFFERTLKYSDHNPEANIWLINGYKEGNEKIKAQDALNVLIARGVFQDRLFRVMKISERELASLRLELEELESLLNERELFVILEKAGYEKEDHVIEELIAYSRERQKNPALSFRIARLAEQAASFDYMFKYAKDYYEGVKNTAGADQDIADTLSASYLFVRSGHAAEAESIMKELHEKYAGNNDVTTDYAYTLLENKKPQTALEVINTLAGEKTPLQLFIKSMACMEMQKYTEALEPVQEMCSRLNILEQADPQFKMLEDYLYRIMLEYNHILGSYGAEPAGQFAGEVGKMGEGELIYHYIFGLEAWRAGEYEKSNAHYGKLLTLNNKLAYPYYLLGVNYNEMAGMVQKDYYAQAERNLLNFINRRQDIPEAYFILGFVYKHSGDPLRAERAFNKVILNNPNREYPDADYFGMYVHSWKEVGNL